MKSFQEIYCERTFFLAFAFCPLSVKRTLLGLRRNLSESLKTKRRRVEDKMKNVEKMELKSLHVVTRKRKRRKNVDTKYTKKYREANKKPMSELKFDYFNTLLRISLHHSSLDSLLNSVPNVINMMMMCVYKTRS